MGLLLKASNNLPRMPLESCTMHKMRNILLSCVIVFSVFPTFAFGAVTYSRTPSGVGSYSSVMVNVAFDSPADITGYAGESYWCVDVYYPASDFDNWTMAIPIADTSESFVVNTSGSVNYVVLGSSNSSTCTNASQVGSYELEYNAEATLFTIASGFNSASFVPIVTGGITTLGLGLLTVFGAVLVLFVAVFLFKRGLRWLKLSAGERRGMSADEVSLSQGYSKEYIAKFHKDTGL